MLTCKNKVFLATCPFNDKNAMIFLEEDVLKQLSLFYQSPPSDKDNDLIFIPPKYPQTANIIGITTLILYPIISSLFLISLSLPAMIVTNITITIITFLILLIIVAALYAIQKTTDINIKRLLTLNHIDGKMHPHPLLQNCQKIPINITCQSPVAYSARDLKLNLIALKKNNKKYNNVPLFTITQIVTQEQQDNVRKIPPPTE